MLPDLSTIALFSAAALALLVVPGPAVLYIVTRSIDQGRAAGLVSMLGIHVGSLVHVAAAAFGLSALLVSSATAFSVVKYLGAGYLVWLGIRRLRSRDEPERPDVRRRDDLGRIFRQGIVVNVLNPKTALFFFAFLPQFVRPDDGSVTVQVLLLGLLFIGLGLLSDGLYAVAAAKAASWLRTNRRWPRIERRVSGGILITLGATAALAGRPAAAD